MINTESMMFGLRKLKKKKKNQCLFLKAERKKPVQLPERAAGSQTAALTPSSLCLELTLVLIRGRFNLPLLFTSNMQRTKNTCRIDDVIYSGNHTLTVTKHRVLDKLQQTVGWHYSRNKAECQLRQCKWPINRLCSQGGHFSLTSCSRWEAWIRLLKGWCLTQGIQQIIIMLQFPN